MNLLLLNLRVDQDDTALGFTWDWIDELAKHFDHITVVTMSRGVVPGRDNVDVLSAGQEKGWSRPRRVAEFYRQLLRALRLRRQDVCFAHMNALFLVLAGPILKLRGIPSILWYAHNHRSRLLRVAAAFADLVIASTKTAFPLETPKLRVIGQGIDTQRFRPPETRAGNGPLRLVTVGRLAPVKNIDLMMRAAKFLATARPALDFRFDIVGEPVTSRDREYVAECKALAASLGIAHHVRWCDSVPFKSVNQVYREGGIFLSANDNGLDKAILEAMASGMPVIAMHPALAEGLGEFCATDEATFQEKLLKVSDFNEDARQRLGLQLREFIEQEHGLPRLGRVIAGLLKGLVK
jgi:glycosyltransferase involved in cell wall biosynthesis